MNDEALAPRSTEDDSKSSSRSSNDASSSTAREDAPGNNNIIANTNDALHQGGAQVNRRDVADTRQSTTAGDSTNGKTFARSDDDVSMPSTMQRTVNTIPVFARSHHRTTVTRAKIPWTDEDHLTKPSASHVAESKHAQTALATNAASISAVAKDDDARSTCSSSVSGSSNEDTGPGRFSSFTQQGSLRISPPPNQRRNKNTTATKTAANGDDTASAAEQDRQTSPLNNAITSIMAAMRGHSEDSTRDGGAGGDLHRSSTQDTNLNALQTPAIEDMLTPHAGEFGSKDGMLSYDEEKRLAGAEEGARGGWSYDDSHDVGNERRALGTGRTALATAGGAQNDGYNADAQSISRHYPLTPGWDTPWRPESRGEHSIKFGKYRFNNFGEGGYFPETEKRRDASKKSKRGRGFGRLAGNSGSGGGRGGMFGGVDFFDGDWWSKFLLYNAFVPLLFRVINVAFTTSTLAIAIKIFQALRSEDAPDAVGSSPIVAIVFCPLTLVHVGVQIYVEYFSRPIGLWRVSSKLFYTLIELIFVCLWSAELSLAFDNYFTSTLVCTSYDSPYANSQGKDNPSVFGEQMLNNPSRKGYICRLQGVLIGLVFTSLLAYMVVLSVSLFRIFVRVSRR